jgi:hypothetical protein
VAPSRSDERLARRNPAPLDNNRDERLFCELIRRRTPRCDMILFVTVPSSVLTVSATETSSFSSSSSRRRHYCRHHYHRHSQLIVQ